MSATLNLVPVKTLRSRLRRILRGMSDRARRNGNDLAFALSAWRLMPALAAVEVSLGIEQKALFHSGRVLLARRGQEGIVLASPPERAASMASAVSIEEFLDSVVTGSIRELYLVFDDGKGPKAYRAPVLLEVARAMPMAFRAWLRKRGRQTPPQPGPDVAATTQLALERLPALDFLAATDPDPGSAFARADTLPGYVFAQPKTRSVLFLNNCYFYFEILADALRRRGWEARTVSFEPPDSPSRRFYWNRDEIIYDADPARHRSKVAEFFRSATDRFGTVHFHGQYQMSVYRDQWTFGGARRVPWDFLELKRRGIVVGYTPSGCLDGATQSSIRAVSSGLCSRCVWELEPNICSDTLNGSWGHQLSQVCDWVSLENDYAVDERLGPAYVRQPVVSALDPSVWRPGLEIPPEHRIERDPGEVLVFHGFANSDTRRTRGRDIKGSGAIAAAVDRLRAEGLPIRLFMAKDIPIADVRFYQSQCDIVVEQLNYGRIGSTARESLMLGRPVVSRIVPDQIDGGPLESMATAPVASADETTIEQVLRDLARDPSRRQEMGRQSRDYALRWHSDDVCAARFEAIVDRVRAGLPADLDRFPQA
jgi:hypothetical protein